MSTPSIDPSDPDEIVEAYLCAINDPASMIDEQRIATLEKELAETPNDFRRRLQLRTELRRAQIPPIDELEQAFIQVAARWADDNNVTPDAFRSEGVDASVLETAGFDMPTKGSRKSSGTRVPYESVYAAAKAMRMLTTTAVIEATGCGQPLARRCIDDLVAEGHFTETFQDTNGTRYRPRRYIPNTGDVRRLSDGRVARGHIADVAKKMETLTAQALSETSGCGRGSARKYLRKLHDEGHLVVVDYNSSGRGSATPIYKWADQ